MKDIKLPNSGQPDNWIIYSSKYSDKPLRALLLIYAAYSVGVFMIGFILYGLLKLPRDFSDINSFSTVILFTSCNILAYFFVPFFLHIPYGKRTFKDYLSDIRITRVKPFWKLFFLTSFCLLILILCQGSGSIVFRLTEGKPLTFEFINKVFDLTLALPPKSLLLVTVSYSMLEEVSFRGVFLTMLLRKYSRNYAIFFSALAFGLAHIFALFAGGEIITTLAQVIWAFIFGIFYGYIFVKTGSLWPSMVIHWLSNVFQSTLTEYWLVAPVIVRSIYGIVFGYGLAAILSIYFVRYFTSKWSIKNNYVC